MENRRVLKKEGLNLTIDKEVLDDQRVLEVSNEIPEKAKVETEDKPDFENYKVLYRGAIDDRCLEEYGTCEDEKLWEDVAKEMFLKVVNYIPEEDKKAEITNLTVNGVEVTEVTGKNYTAEKTASSANTEKKSVSGYANMLKKD